MSIPQNISKEHLLKAIHKIDQEGIPAGGDSRYYDVHFNGHKYPPKLVVSYANIFANGNVLDRNSFGGGKDTECFKILEKHGFTIQQKNFFQLLIDFLNQAQTKSLETKPYPKKFNGLQLKVSFGQGNSARIPWIALLRDDQTVSNGIYPVYLYYKNQNILILAYGVSETHSPPINWTLDSSTYTINKAFQEQYQTKPERYGNSYVYEVYSLDTNSKDFGLNEKKVNKDLDRLIDIYNQLPLESENESPLPKAKSNGESQQNQIPFDHKEFRKHTEAANLKFSESLIIRFASALCTKPFVILTGLAGSGKTKLAQSFSQWICEDESQLCIVAVGADWTNRDPLLGYPNALESNRYFKPENKALTLLIEAAKPENAHKPYFLILDEMNLSHVERYFADFLSVMESEGTISLHSGLEHWDGVPSAVKLPRNLFIVGTVNVDETTYMFSPKVLDRANVIEFRVTQEEMAAFLFNPVKADLSKLKGAGANMASDFISKATNSIDGSSATQGMSTALLEFFLELKKAGAEFGYRSAAEINRFVKVASIFEPSWEEDAILDAAFIQKLLPKVHGSRRKLEPVLKALAGLCLIKKEEVGELLNKPENIRLDDKSMVRFPLSLEKIIRMHKAAIQDGFTSFAEA
jgi:5-methylcytosine-specific restriction enzyme B